MNKFPFNAEIVLTVNEPKLNVSVRKLTVSYTYV